MCVAGAGEVAGGRSSIDAADCESSRKPKPKPCPSTALAAAPAASSTADLPAATLPTDDEMRCRVTWSIPGVSGATQMHYASAAACEGDYLLSVTLARDVREVGP